MLKKGLLVFGLSLALALGTTGVALAKSKRVRAEVRHELISSEPLLNSVTFDPIALAFGLGNLEYQRLVTPTSALAARILFGWGFGVGASYRFYLLDNVPAPEGLWLGPGLDLYGYSYTYGGQTASGTFFMPKAEVGYRFMFPMGRRLAFVVAPELALGASLGSVSVAGSTYSGGFFFGLGCGLGLAF